MSTSSAVRTRICAVAKTAIWLVSIQVAVFVLGWIGFTGWVFGRIDVTQHPLWFLAMFVVCVGAMVLIVRQKYRDALISCASAADADVKP